MQGRASVEINSGALSPFKQSFDKRHFLNKLNLPKFNVKVTEHSDGTESILCIIFGDSLSALTSQDNEDNLTSALYYQE